MSRHSRILNRVYAITYVIALIILILDLTYWRP